MFVLALAAYVLAMTAANISIAFFGPWISPVNAFIFIGLDLTLRDWLHERINKWRMVLLIVFSGFVTWLLNPGAGIIAIASAASFVIAGFVDYAVFSKAKGSWMERSTKSNVVGAAVDSLAFPTIAFGALMPEIVILQFVAKLAGGAVWAFLINRCLNADSVD